MREGDEPPTHLSEIKEFGISVIEMAEALHRARQQRFRIYDRAGDYIEGSRMIQGWVQGRQVMGAALLLWRDRPNDQNRRKPEFYLNQILDAMRMWNDTPREFIDGMHGSNDLIAAHENSNWRDIFRTHDIISGMHRRYMAAQRMLPIRDVNARKPNYKTSTVWHSRCPFQDSVDLHPKHDMKANERVTVLKTIDDFIQEGNDMEHCITSYFCNHNRCYFVSVHVVDNGVIHASTAELFLSLKEEIKGRAVLSVETVGCSIKVRSHQGFNNQIPHSKCVEALKRWLEIQANIISSNPKEETGNE